jgi:hypothetical protein
MREKIKWNKQEGLKENHQDRLAMLVTSIRAYKIMSLLMKEYRATFL